KSKDAAKRPKTSGPGRPDLSKVKPGAKHHGPKEKAKRVPQWIRQLLIADGQEGVLGFLPDFDATFEAPISRQQSAIAALAASLDLTDEQPTVTLYDSAQYADLTNWLNAHPEDLSGAK